MKKIRVFLAVPFIVLGVVLLVIGLGIGAGKERTSVLLTAWKEETERLMEGSE